jgi:hypothetical protein
MGCLVPLIVGVCLASPENLTIELQADWRVSGPVAYKTRNGIYSGALARPAILMDVPVSRGWEFSYGYNHLSALSDSSDSGAEYVFVRVQWRPFR